MNEYVDHLGIFLAEESGEWISVQLYACKKNKHLYKIPDDENLRSPKQEADLVVLKSGKCPAWNCW
jgi:hypothetical protein